MSSLPRVTFGMIVLNGEPFLRYNLRALYPFAHQIIVVEGAAPGAASIATEDGHSLDSTLETLHQFKQEEDPDDKLIIVTKDGFWSEKDEMSQAYAQRADGDYLWQVDVDEFYMPAAIETVVQMLQNDPTITAVTFNTLTFWAAPNYIVEGWPLLWGDRAFHRLFKWEPGYRYTSHRPPTVVDQHDTDLRQIHHVDGDTLEQRGIVMYHYSLLLPKQVREKSAYYKAAAFSQRERALEWVEQAYMQLNRPFRVHNLYDYPGWLLRYDGPHPPQIQAMWDDLTTGRAEYDLRQTDDIERIIDKASYRLKRAVLHRMTYPAWWLWRANRKRRTLLQKLRK